MRQLSGKHCLAEIWLVASTLLFQPQTVTLHKPPTPIEDLSNTLQGVDFGSILGQFLVSSVKNDQKPTKNRPKTDSKPTLARIPTGVYP